MRSVHTLLICSILIATGCSSNTERQAKTYAAGEKAPVDKLTYAVVDTQIHPRLGEDASARTPQYRFYTIQIAVSSGASADIPIPTLTLVDDSGKSYPELADGTGLQHWLGVVRRVAPAQTERGEILFDAPAAHYKLKLTDESDASDVFIDLPLNYVHEQLGNEGTTADPSDTAPPAGATPPITKKK